MRYYLLFILIIISLSSQGQDKLDLLVRSEKVLASGDTSRAILAFSEILRLYPQSFAAALRLAEINYQQKDYTQSVQYCNVALDITDNFIESTERSSKVLGLEPDSSRKYRQFITDQAYIHFLKGKIRIQQNRLTDAVHEFRQSVNLNPNDPEPILNLADILAEMGHLEEAKMLLLESVKRHPDNISLIMNLGGYYNAISNYDSAFYYWDKVTKIDSTYKWAHLSIAKLKTEQRKLDEAIEYYNSFISLDTLSIEAYYRRAVLFVELSKWEMAINYWTEVVQLDPNNAEAWRNRGLTNFQLKSYNAAIDDFSRALAIEPAQNYTQINKGYCLYLIGKPKDALKHIDEGLKFVPNYALGHYFKSLTFYQLRKKKKSCLSLSKALELGMNEEEVSEELKSICYK